MILVDALRRAERAASWPVTARGLAQAYVDWPERWKASSRREFAEQCDEWLKEYRLAARWVLGERDLATARPPERLWVGLPTCWGQMALLPLAGIYPGEPEQAYLAAWNLGFADNGWGRDLNVALVAGLAAALTTNAQGVHRRAGWKEVVGAMRSADPFQYAQAPWSQRSVERWLEVAMEAVRDSEQRPARCFARLDEEFMETTKWEAQVPFVVTIAVLELCDCDPLAALQLSIEWGHDADSYAQLVGALVGAMHGPEVFPASLCTAVADRMELDYGEKVDEWVELLMRLKRTAATGPLFAPV